LTTKHLVTKIVVARRYVRMRIWKIPIDALVPDARQTGKEVDEEYVRSLADSYDESGPTQPLVVRPSPAQGLYLITAGVQRWKASKLKGLKHLDCIVETDISERNARGKTFLEHFLQQKVNVVDQGEAFLDYRNEFGLSQEQLAKELNLDQSTVSMYESLVTRLAPWIIHSIRKRRLDGAVAFELTKIVDKARQHEVFEAMTRLGIYETAKVARIVAAVNVAPTGTDIDKLAKEFGHPARPGAKKRKTPSAKAASDKLIDDIVDFYRRLKSVDFQQIPSHRWERISSELGQLRSSIDRSIDALHGTSNNATYSCGYCRSESGSEHNPEGWSMLLTFGQGGEFRHSFCCYEHLFEWLKKEQEAGTPAIQLSAKKTRKSRKTKTT
jgi:ParB/RepB/Spo0J family partition protein